MPLLEARRARLVLIDQVKRGNAKRYRALALYLQVLREGLLNRIQQACFHLATQVYPQRYAALRPPQRLELHRRLEALVERCSTLLTVEQLAVLAHQQAQQKMARSQRQQRRFLQSLRDSAEQTMQQPARDQVEPLPQGSIRLGLDLPLSTDLLAGQELFTTGFPSRVPASEAAARGTASFDQLNDTEGPADPDHFVDSDRLVDQDSLLDQDSLMDLDALDRDDLDSDDPGNDVFDLDGLADGLEDDLDDGLDHGRLDGDDLEISGMESTGSSDPESEASHTALMAAFGQLLEASLRDGPAGLSDKARSDRADQQDQLQSDRFPSDQPESAQPQSAHPASDQPAPESTAPDSLWTQGSLPTDPVALTLWFEGMDAALTRRLRNLSHAINVELLRLGLIRSLLPVNLLDAVLQGQVDTLPAGPNLVRLALSFPDPSGQGSLESIALLLRAADLELELPSLRTCRRRLEQVLQEDRRIAEQFRRLERRIQVLEAEVLWLEDNKRLKPPEQLPPQEPPAS